MAAPTGDNTLNKTASGNGVTSLTISSFAVGAGSNRLLMVSAQHYNNPDRTVSSVAFNTSETFSVHDQNTQAAFGGTQRVTLHYLKQPTQTTANIVVTYSGSVAEAIVGAASFFDVDQTIPWDAATKNQTASGTAPTVTVPTTTTDQLIIATVIGGDNGVTCVATGTQMWQTVSGSIESRGAAQYKSGTGSSVVMNWTGGTLANWAVIAAPLNGAAGGGGGSPDPWVPSMSLGLMGVGR